MNESRRKGLGVCPKCGSIWSYDISNPGEKDTKRMCHSCMYQYSDSGEAIQQAEVHTLSLTSAMPPAEGKAKLARFLAGLLDRGGA